MDKNDERCCSRVGCGCLVATLLATTLIGGCINGCRNNEEKVVINNYYTNTTTNVSAKLDQYSVDKK